MSQCSLGASATEKAEAGRISRAIDVLRDAPNAQKAELLGALKSAHCEAADLCDLQRLCVEGYAQHVQALSETARAKALLTTAGAGAGAQAESEAAAALDSARRGLSLAASKIGRCADAQGAAHRKYKF